MAGITKKALDPKKMYMHLTIAALIFALCLLIPTENGLAEKGPAGIGIFISIIYLCITVDPIWPSLLAIGLVNAIGIMTPQEALAIGFSNVSVVFIVVCTIYSNALTKTGVVETIAKKFLSSKFCAQSPFRFITVFLGTVVLLGFFLPQLPLMMIFMSFANGVCEQLGYKKSHRFPCTLMMGMVILLSIAASSTPFAHARVLIIFDIVKDFGIKVNTFGFILVACALTICIYFITLICLRLFNREKYPEFSKYAEFLQSQPSPKLSFTKEGKITIATFVLCIISWIGADIFAAYPEVSAFFTNFGMVGPCVVMIAALCIIHVDGKPILDINDAVKNGPWGTFLFCVGLRVVAALLTSEATGITVWISNVLEPFIEGVPGMIVVSAALLAALISTQFATNTVPLNVVTLIVTPILLAMNAAGANENIFVVAVMISIFSNMAWMLPSANIASPMMFEAGYFDDKKYFYKNSIIILIAVFLFSVLVFYPIASQIVHF